MIRFRATASVLALLTLACGPSETALGPAGDWVGTITTEGDVTTVVTESGSVWNGTATLVEEASIGVEVGADVYMLGYLYSIAADDERIVLVDGQAVAVRAYDLSGAHLETLGGQGQGPGEYTRPRSVAIDGEGRTYVLDPQLGRINVYGADGSALETWPVPNPACCGWPMYPGDGGTLYVPHMEIDGETRERRYGIRHYGSAGPIGDTVWVPDIGFERITYSFDGREISVPLGPRLAWGPTAGGGIFAGSTDRYRFEVHAPDGATLVIERRIAPVPFPAEEIEWNRRLAVAGWQQQQPGWSWDGAEIPRQRPAFLSIVPVASGGFWVSRETDSRKVADCTDDPLAPGAIGRSPLVPCWEAEWAIDAFAADGRYLGEVEAPEVMAPFQLLLRVDGDRVITGAEDAEGVFRVKRYRLVLPGGQE